MLGFVFNVISAAFFTALIGLLDAAIRNIAQQYNADE